MAVKFINLVIVFVLLKLSTLMPMELSENLVFYGPHTAIQSLQDREEERNKAELNIKVFKDLTLEFSAIIGGKYGISNQEKSPDEWTWLGYSIIRTRHKFSGAKDILPRFYGVGDVNKLSSDHRAHLAAVLTIDTLAAEAIGNEDLLNQWAEIKADQPVNAKFINDVKSHAKAWTKELLVTTLEPAIDSFLQNAKTIALAHDVFSMFAPKITLKTIYSEMFSGEYRDWTVHGFDSFANLLTPKYIGHSEKREKFAELEGASKKALLEKIPQDSFNIPCLSVVADLASPELSEKLSLKPKTVILEYVFNCCLDEMYSGESYLFIKDLRRLQLTRNCSQNLCGLFSWPNSKVSEEELLDIYSASVSVTARVLKKESGPEYKFSYSQGFNFLMQIGCSETMVMHALNFLNGDGVRKDPHLALKIFREALDLGYAGPMVPLALNALACALYNKKSLTEDTPQAIELFKEASALGNEQAKRYLEIILK